MKLNPDIKHEGKFDIKPETKHCWFEHNAVSKKEAKLNHL